MPRSIRPHPTPDSRWGRVDGYLPTNIDIFRSPELPHMLPPFYEERNPHLKQIPPGGLGDAELGDQVLELLSLMGQ